MFIIVILFMPLPHFQDDFSDVVLDRNGKILRVFLNSKDQWIFPEAKDEIPQKLATSVIVFEDKRFFYHIGIDPFALGRAVYQMIRAGEYVSGASTIPMQVVRIEGQRKRNLANKIIEMLIALKFDLFSSKDKILRLYLDHAPYGGNIVGYQAASWRYWGRPPQELTWAEAATIAVLPNNPSRVNPARNPAKLKKKRDSLLKKLFQKGYFDSETYQLAVLEDIPDEQIHFPLIAPHLCRRVSREKDGFCQTTIDFTIQEKIEKILKEYQRNISNFGVDNCCALVVETETGKVCTYVGSSDFFGSRAGRVDGVFAKRSYGSLLKPFLYALSFERGLIHPKSSMKDIPTYYGAFSPANASKSYRGLVRAEEALQLSLNVPAVRLLYSYSYFDFHKFLLDAGVKSLSQSPEHYGLTLILGGGEASMWELVRLYRTLGNLGKYGDIGYYESEYPFQKRVLKSGSSYQTLEIIRELSRPGTEHFWDLFQNQWPLAWKTGTSYGHRDAWACGVSPQWTIAVWTGNFDGRGNPAIVGTDLAAPLLFRIFNSLPRSTEKIWWQEPESELEFVDLCSETGFLAGVFCPDSVSAKVPVGSNLKRCDKHKRVFLSLDRQKFVCSLCWGKHEPIDSVWLYNPPEVINFLRKQGKHYKEPLLHRQNCSSNQSVPNFNVIYPIAGGSIVLPLDGVGQRKGLVARAVHSHRESELFWYLDGKFIGSTIQGSGISEHSTVLSMGIGNHILTVVDGDGQSIELSFKTTD